MTLKFARYSLVTLGVILFLATPTAIYSCGPFFEETVFAFETQPENGTGFAAGKLGIVRPGFRRAYLVVAYRYLLGLGLSPEQQRAALDVWSGNVVPGYVDQQDALSSWGRLRSTIAKPSPGPVTSAYAAVSVGQPYEQFLNCPVEAFKNAVATLQNRIAQFGAESDAVREWISGQDQVFANCDGRQRMIPAVLTSGEPLIQADRRYQIAAAHFYAREFDEAANEFDSIAKDTNSPWTNIGSYLAARALIRKASVVHGEGEPFDRSAMSAAQERLERIVNDPHAGTLRDSANKLLNFVRFRTEPEKRIAELEHLMSSRDVGTNFRQDLWDYVLLLSHGERADDLSDWLETFYAGQPGIGQNRNETSQAEHSIGKWREEKSLPWLVAALTFTEPNEAGVPDLLEAANSLPAASPGYLTIRHQAIRLMIARDQTDQARKELDALLKRSDLPQGASNLFNEERQKITTGLDDFLRHAAEQAVGVQSDADNSENSFTGKPATGRLFNHFSAEVFMKRMPLSMLAASAKSTILPQQLRRELARTAWVRSVLVEDNQETARRLQPVLHEVDPALWSAMEPFRAASNNPEKRFAAVLIMLSNPGMKPSVREGALRSATLGELDSLRDNWWCADMSGEQNWGKYGPYGDEANLKFVERDPDFPFPAWMSDAEKTASKSEWQKLSAVGTGPNYLAKQVLAYAKERPDDAQVPQALYLVVRATHLGCTNIDTTKLSKAAFEFLHGHYPTSEWTARTKYYY